MAQLEDKQALVDSNADEVLPAGAFAGPRTNIARPGIIDPGLDPDAQPKRGVIAVSRDIEACRPRRRRGVRSAEHCGWPVPGICGVDALFYVPAAAAAGAP